MMLPAPTTAVAVAACLIKLRRVLPVAAWSLSWLIKLVLLSFDTVDIFFGESKPELNSGTILFVLSR